MSTLDPFTKMSLQTQFFKLLELCKLIVLYIAISALMIPTVVIGIAVLAVIQWRESTVNIPIPSKMRHSVENTISNGPKRGIHSAKISAQYSGRINWALVIGYQTSFCYSRNDFIWRFDQSCAASRSVRRVEWIRFHPHDAPDWTCCRTTNCIRERKNPGVLRMVSPQGQHRIRQPTGFEVVRVGKPLVVVSFFGFFLLYCLNRWIATMVDTTMPFEKIRSAFKFQNMIGFMLAFVYNIIYFIVP